ncbi:MAG TPA: DUF5916 domain-containing protein, partial [Candidatus Glassbacteria bacterium]|nr:DUF5916 domain-containing protein [Candidatus Glassbacteria bacterium]
YFGAWQAFDNSEDAFRAAADYNFIFEYPRGHGFWYGIANDYSSPFNVSVNQNIGTFRDGDQWSGSINFRLRPRPNLEISLQPRIDRKKKFSEFSSLLPAETETPGSALTLRDTRFESIVLRTSYTMNNKLDFRLFAQYTDFGSQRYDPLEDSGWLIDTPHDARSTFGVHFVTRFEYRPGSYFYLVYKENRYDDYDGGGFGRPDRQLIGKFTYWLSKG